MKSHVGIVGLGDMGGAVAANLLDRGVSTVLYNRTREKCVGFMSRLDGELHHMAEIADTVPDLFGILRRQGGDGAGRAVIWMMLPGGEATNGFVSALRGQACRGDIIIDAANANYRDSVANHAMLAQLGVSYLDVGFAGGPIDCRNQNAMLMVGGDEKAYAAVERVIRVVAGKGNYGFVGGPGSGHLVKGISNCAFYAKTAIDAEMYASVKAFAKHRAEMKIDQSEVYRLVSRIPNLNSESMLAGADALLHGKLPEEVPSLSVSGMVNGIVEESREDGISLAATEAVLKEYPNLASDAKRIYAAIKRRITGH